MKAWRLRAENFMRLVFVDTPLGRGVQKIVGKNGQGKSAILNALRWGFGGAKNAPDEIVRHGQESAEVLIETDDFILRRRATVDGGKGGDVTLESKDGKTVYKRPQEMLNKLFGGGVVAFDPVGFSRMKPRDQADLLRQVTGLDTTDIDAERKATFDERTIINREVAQLKAKLADMDEPAPIPEPPAEQDVSAFVAEIEAAAKTQAKNDNARRMLRDIERQCDEKKAAIERLQKELEELSVNASAGRVFVASLVDPDVTAIKTRLEDAKTQNARIRGQRQLKATADRRANEYATLKQSLADAERKSNLHTTHLGNLDTAKRELLDKTPMPVPGLGIDGDVVTLDGVPFSQAASSQKIRVGLAIGAALNPGIETLLVEEGSFLDEDQLHFVEEWAEENGIQIIMEIVGDVADGITIEAGRVKEIAK